MKYISRLILSFGIVMLTLLIPDMGDTNPDSVGVPAVPDEILQSKAAFAVVDEAIARHLNLSALSEWDYQKLRGPVLWKIRAPIHSYLRKAFGRIVDSADFGGSADSFSQSQTRPMKPILHKRAAEIIRDFINQEHISVIIRSNAPIGIGEVAAIRGLRGEMRYIYESINGACVVIPIKNLAALIRRPFITEMWPDSRGNLKLADSVPQIGADVVHKPPTGLGVTGEGVYVAVVDGGIDSNHPELRGRVVDTRGVLGGGGSNEDKDDVDHGTHVAGIIAANGPMLTGVAPEVELLDAQADWKQDSFIFGNSEFFELSQDNYSDTMDAIRWASRKNRILKSSEKADIINLSAGWDAWEYGRDGGDPMSQLIDEVVDSDIVFVVAAGNEALRRATGDIISNLDPINTEEHEFKVGKLGIVKVTLLWDKAAHDLDLSVLEHPSGKMLYNSRTRTSVFNNSLSEQIVFTEKTGNVWYTLQVEAPFGRVQDSQNYEVWVSKGSEFDHPDSAKTVNVPAYSQKAITVGAVDHNNAATSFSSQGPSSPVAINPGLVLKPSLIKPEIVAPGESIESTIRGSGYKETDGTSMAAPHVAGVAALILDAVGKNDQGEWNFNPDEVKSAIVRGAEAGVGSIPNTPNNTYGAGLVKADNIIFSNTVPANGRLRFEIIPRLYNLNYGVYRLNADPYLTAAISWKNSAHNLDLALSDASNGKTLPMLSQVASSSAKIGGNEFILPSPGATYFLDVINRSQEPVTFTGASTHPIQSQELNISHSTLTTQTHSILSVAFSPNRGNSTLAYGSADGTVHLWDVSTKSLKHTLRGHTDHVLSVAFSPDGRILASGSTDGTVRLWDTRTGNLRDTLHGHTNVVLSVAFSLDGRTLASGSLDGTTRLWDPSTGRHKRTLTGDLIPVLSVAFSPDGRTLASGATDGIVRLWNPSTGKLLHKLHGHTDFVLSTAFRADGQILASGGADGTVRLWDISTRNLQHTLTAHTDWVNSVAFSPDANSYKLASGGADGTVHLWDTYTGDQHTLTAHKNSVESVAFSADGSTLASGDADGKVLLWEFTPSASGQSVALTIGPQVIADVDGNGVVDIIDLVQVASLFGTEGQSDADVNGDSVVDIVDLVLVANAFGNTANAPALRSLAIEHLTTEQVSQWLQEAKVLEKTSVGYQRGILVLEQLLALLTPQETVLLLNYPNPFNPETWIPYQLSEPADVTVTIHSINGSLIRTLALGHQSAGVYQSKSRAAYWDGRNQLGEPVASGLYFYTLNAGEFTATRKMLIRK